MTITNLRDHASAQCCVRHYENGDLCLQSYNTDVIYYNALFKRLYCTGTYSQTTRRHISWFLREYFPSFSYHDLKAAYEQDCRINADVTSRLSMTPLLDEERSLMLSAHYGKQLNPDCFKEVAQ